MVTLTYVLESGVAQTWWQVLAGRVISGAGGAGVISLVFIVIAGKSHVVSTQWYL
jgi:hypothetical protein